MRGLVSHRLEHSLWFNFSAMTPASTCATTKALSYLIDVECWSPIFAPKSRSHSLTNSASLQCMWHECYEYVMCCILKLFRHRFRFWMSQPQRLKCLVCLRISAFRLLQSQQISETGTPDPKPHLGNTAAKEVPSSTPHPLPTQD